MAFIVKEKLFSKDWFKAYGLIVIGTLIMASAYVLFISPYKFAPGGVYGIAIVLHHLFGLPIGLMGLAMDIPLVIAGFIVLGPRFGAKTITGMVTLSLWISLLELTYGYKPFVADQPLLSSIYGGFLLGLGLGLVFKSKATSGGSDIIAMIIAKYTNLPLGQLMIWIDSAIVLVGWAAFQDPIIPLISWVIIFITGKVVDVVLQGINYEKTLFIISDKYEEIERKIVDDLRRGGTSINGKGIYNQSDRTIIFTVVNRRELAILQDFIHRIDPNAFLTVIDANEVLGQGFKSLRDKVSS
ncbi:MAG: YitT family protein [Bacteroidales bacterium]|nr:YitT family protein [Bacteroidales bacterium]